MYRLALRGERCFEYNRALLLLAPLLAAALPLLPRPALPLWLTSPTVAVAAGKTGIAAVLLPVVQVRPATAPTAGWSVWTGLGAIYLAGAVLGLGRLWWLARRLPRARRPGYVLAYTGGRLPASSFGRVVFWDETASLPPAEAAAVLAHVQQRHTADVLWLEAWRAVLWPNPFAHLLLPALRLTHELLADAAAAPTTGAAYPTLLARLAARQRGAPVYSPLLQPFTFSFTLTRIAMLQNQNPVRRWKQWLVLPALGGLFLAACQDTARPTVVAKGSTSRTYWFTSDEAMDRAVREVVHLDSMRTNGKFEPGTTMRIISQELPHKSGERKQVTVTITRVPISTRLSVVIDRVNAKPLSVTSSGHKVYGFVEQLPQLPGGGGMGAIADSIQSNIVYPNAKAGEKLPAGRLFARFAVDIDGTVQNPSIIKGLHPALDAAVLAAIEQLPRFKPGQQGGQAVAVSLTLPVYFRDK